MLPASYTHLSTTQDAASKAGSHKQEQNNVLQMRSAFFHE